MLPLSKNNFLDNDDSGGGKKIFLKCVACVCLTFGTIFLVNAFFMANGFMMGVMTISFAQTIDLYKSPWNSENFYFTKTLF